MHNFSGKCLHRARASWGFVGGIRSRLEGAEDLCTLHQEISLRYRSCFPAGAPLTQCYEELLHFERGGQVLCVRHANDQPFELEEE